EVAIASTLLGFTVALAGFVYPVWRYLQRADTPDTPPMHRTRPTLTRMLLAAGLAGVGLIGTWGSTQWATAYAAQMVQHNEEHDLKARTGREPKDLSSDERNEITRKSGAARESTLIWASAGAITGTILAALAGDLFGRRLTYLFMCAGSMGSALLFYQTGTHYDGGFLVMAFFMGLMTASFYGWLPLYLPELFRTSVRATGQGFGFNFGRILAAIGALQTGKLTEYGYPTACSIISCIYVVGMIVIWFAPETKGKPLPE